MKKSDRNGNRIDSENRRRGVGREEFKKEVKEEEEDVEEEWTAKE